jgi:outer membrane protein assembly factor BamB
VASFAGAVACRDLETGNEVWRRDTGEPLADPALSLSGDALLVAGRRSVWALSAADGEPRWSLEPGGNVVGATPHREGAFVACEDGRVLFASAAGAAVVATLDGYAAGAPLAARDSLLITDGKKSLHCYNIE